MMVLQDSQDHLDNQVLKYKESLSLALLDHGDQMEILDLLVQPVQRESEEKGATRVLLVLRENRDVSRINLNILRSRKTVSFD